MLQHQIHNQSNIEYVQQGMKYRILTALYTVQSNRGCMLQDNFSF